MKFIDFEIKTGLQNMQTDSDLIDFAVKNSLNEPIFRLYAWSPACVSLGRNQSGDFLDKNFLKLKNIDTVKRLTGGRALLHDKELTYSFICPVNILKNAGSIIKSYKEISQILINAFEDLGINLEFSDRQPRTKFDYCMSASTGADLCFEGRKIIGSAQFRKKGYILQHGSILFDYDKELLEKIFCETINENAITCLKQINPRLSFEIVSSVLKKHAKLFKKSMVQ